MREERDELMIQTERAEKLAGLSLLLAVITVVGVLVFLIKAIATLLDPDAPKEEKRQAGIILMGVAVFILSLPMIYWAGNPSFNFKDYMLELFKTPTASMILFVLFFIALLVSLASTVFYALLYRGFSLKADLIKAGISCFAVVVFFYCMVSVGISTNGLALLGKDSSLSHIFYSGHFGYLYVPSKEGEYVFVKGQELYPYLKAQLTAKPVKKIKKEKVTKSPKQKKEENSVNPILDSFNQNEYYAVKVLMDFKGETTFSFVDVAKNSKKISEDRTFDASTSIFTEKPKYNRISLFQPVGLFLPLVLIFISVILYFFTESVKRVAQVGKSREVVES